MQQTLTLPFASSTQRIHAAEVIAQLARECVGFSAILDTVIRSDDTIVITFTGAF